MMPVNRIHKTLGQLPFARQMRADFGMINRQCFTL